DAALLGRLDEVEPGIADVNRDELKLLAADVHGGGVGPRMAIGGGRHGDVDSCHASVLRVARRDNPHRRGEDRKPRPLHSFFAALRPAWNSSSPIKRNVTLPSTASRLPSLSGFRSYTRTT